MKTGYIYKITNPKGSIYIGQTINLKTRISKYRNCDCKGQKKLYHSLTKYGWDSHNFEIIEEVSSEYNKFLLNLQEMYWIDHYDSFNNGLNLTSGGKGTIGASFNKGRKCSDETKKTLSNKLKGNRNGVGYKPTDDQIKKMSTSLKGNKHAVGFSHSEEFKERLSRERKGVGKSEETKEKMRLAAIKRWQNKNYTNE